VEGILRISEAANLAIHAMAYLGAAPAGTSVSVPEIAAALGRSKDHLGKVLQRLTRVGLVGSQRGPRGGFTLMRDTAEVTLLQVVEAIDGPLLSGTCLLGEPICESNHCILGGLMGQVYRQVHEHLAATSLADLAFKPLAGIAGLERPVPVPAAAGRRRAPPLPEKPARPRGQPTRKKPRR
jgi:Rrf2 family transcriptional regulator, nitric oxide-sensitive transcriptional repressor